MLTGYEQDDDVTVLVLHVPERDGQPPAPRPRAAGVIEEGAGMTNAGTISQARPRAARGMPGGGPQLYEPPSQVRLRWLTGQAGAGPPPTGPGWSRAPAWPGQRAWPGKVRFSP